MNKVSANAVVEELFSESPIRHDISEGGPTSYRRSTRYFSDFSFSDSAPLSTVSNIT